ncbi:MAG: hypothetical protein ABIW38_11275 [Ferruginibacter sp.]
MASITSKDDIIISIPRKMYDKNIQQMIDYIEFKKIVSKSKAKQKDIDALLLQIKKERRPLINDILKRIGKEVK